MLADSATIPVVNALSDHEHPCQILADLLTLHERRGRLKGLRLAYVGDANNVAVSLLLAAGKLGIDVSVAIPPEYRPDAETQARIDRIFQRSGASLMVHHDPLTVATGADAVYTDTWTSMGQEGEADVRRNAFQGYQVTADLMAAAAPDAVFMHCLPAHRGEEVTDEVIDSPASVVYEQAENRLHTAKAILLLVAQSAGPVST